MSSKMFLVLAVVAGLWPAAAPALDAQSLVRQFEADHVDSVEAAVRALPPALRSRYALVFRSRSLQQASLEAPRAILYGNDARFVVSFNGDPAQRGYGALEVMEYDAAAARFEYREIGFDQGRPTLSAANPEKCAVCHGHPARPIWDTFPSWPGVYGQSYLAPLSDAERRGLLAFVAAAPAHPRYRELLDLGRFADPNTFSPSARFLYSGQEGEPPNAALSRLLGGLALDKITAELAASPHFAALRYALLASLSPDCGAPQEFFGRRQAADFGADFSAFAEAAASKTADELRRKQTRLGDAAASYGSAAAPRPETLAPLRFLVERFMGLPTSAWTLALEKDTYDFGSALPVAQQLEARLLARLAASDPELADLASLRKLGDPEKYCRHLRWKSLAATADLAPAPQAAAPSQPRGLALCESCHQGTVAPALPFASPERLARSLGRGGYARGSLLDEILYRLSPAAGPDSMPRGTNLDESERAALEAYFEVLAAKAGS